MGRRVQVDVVSGNTTETFVDAQGKTIKTRETKSQEQTDSNWQLLLDWQRFGMLPMDQRVDLLRWAFYNLLQKLAERESEG